MQVNTTKSNKEVIGACNVVIIAVKPQNLDEALTDCQISNTTPYKTFISILVGVSLDTLEKVILQSILLILC